MRFRLSFCALAGALFATSACVSPAPEESVVGDYLSGRFAARVNDVEAAAAAFADAQTEAPEAAELTRDAFFFQLAAGRVEAAMPLAAKLAAAEGGDDGLSRVALAARSMKRGEYARARDYLSEGIEAGYLTASVQILNAWAIAGLEGPEAAFTYLNQPGSEAFRGFNPLHQALLADKAGMTDAARAAHQLSVMTLGGPVGRSAYGAFLEREGDENAARDYYALLAQDPGADRRRALQGLARLDAGEASGAFAQTSPSEGAAIALYSLGAAILEQAVNQRDAAQRAGFRVGTLNYNLPLALTQMALYLDPDFEDALRFAGSILNVYGDNESAIAVLSRIDPSSPYYEQARIDTAAALRALDREEEAIALLREASARDETALEARWALGNILAAEERHAEAVEALTPLIEQLPEEPDEDAWRYYIARAASLLQLYQWPRAEIDLKRAVEIAPEEPTALNYLGYSWAERGENLEEAFSLIEKAVSLQPDSGAIIDSLGWAHYQLGDYDEAVGHLEQAAALEPGDPVITDHLGDVYWRLGRRTEARFQWTRVLELEPDAKLQAAVERKLEQGLPAKGSEELQR